MSGQRRIVTLLRWVMFLALASLVWAGGATLPAVQIGLLVAVAASNVALSFVGEKIWEHPALLPAVAAADVAVLTAGMILGLGFERDFFFAYFLVLAVVALSGTLRWAAAGTVAISAGYGVVMALQNGEALLHAPELIARLGFLFSIGVAYGGLTDAANSRRREAVLRRQLVGWVEKLSAAFSEDFNAIDLIRQVLQDVQALYPGAVRTSVVQIVGGKVQVIGSSDDGTVREFELDPDAYPELMAAIDSGEPLIIEDVATHPLMSPLRAKVAKLPFTCLLLCPVAVGDRDIGHVVLRVARSGGKFSPATVMATVDVARAIGVIFRQAKTREAMEQSERLAMVSQITSNVAHSFNGILSTVLLSSEVLRKQVARHAESADCQAPPCDDASARRFEAIELAVREGMSIVDRLAAWNRLGRTSSADHDGWRRIDPATLLQEAWGYARPLWLRRRDTRDLQLQLELRPAPSVHGNPTELREVLLNLIVNAIDAMPKGGTMTLGLLHEDDRVGFRVSDSGLGMSDDQLQHAFDAFYSTKGSAGAGLGLSIARSVANRHCGEIAVESALGVGTTFDLWLPVATTDEMEVEPADSGSGRVLLVEGSDLVRDVLLRFLEGAGFDVDGVSCLDEAEVLMENRRDYLWLVADAASVEREIEEFLDVRAPAMKNRFLLVSNGELPEGLAALQQRYGFPSCDRSSGLAALGDLIEQAEPHSEAA